MFRKNPDYIVAGEIVRTTRMYAMSVSPLPWETLERISPALVSGLRPLNEGRTRGRRAAGYAKDGAFASEETAGSGGRIKRARDFTSHIKIGNEVFEIETVKGKKIVKLLWEKLKPAIDQISAETTAMYKDLRGSVIVDGKYTILGNEKLKFILSLIPGLDIDGALSRKRPRKENYNSSSNLDDLLEILPGLVKPAIWKQGKKELGFIGLFTDGKGSYWVRCSRGFHTSLNESISSVETLIDELGEEVDIEKKHKVNQCYRRLSAYL